jgi:hypothetical protein
MRAEEMCGWDDEGEDDVFRTAVESLARASLLHPIYSVQPRFFRLVLYFSFIRRCILKQRFGRSFLLLAQSEKIDSLFLLLRPSSFLIYILHSSAVISDYHIKVANPWPFDISLKHIIPWALEKIASIPLPLLTTPNFD